MTFVTAWPIHPQRAVAGGCNSRQEDYSVPWGYPGAPPTAAQAAKAEVGRWFSDSVLPVPAPWTCFAGLMNERFSRLGHH